MKAPFWSDIKWPPIGAAPCLELHQIKQLNDVGIVETNRTEAIFCFLERPS